MSVHATLAQSWRGKLHAALTRGSQVSTSSDQFIPAVITDHMTLPEVIAILVQNSCPNVTRELDLASCSTQPLARGAFNDIYRGTLLDGSLVAIKTPRLYLKIERFALTARGVYAWSKCNHPNILPFIGLAELHGEPTTVSPWMGNGSIRDYVNKQPGADRFNLCTQIACGLAYLHSIGIVHSNFEGSNILVSDLGVPVIGGFGNSTPGESTIHFAQMKDDASVSVRWAAPELLQGLPGTSSTAADVYALGMATETGRQEVFTGKIPYYYIEHDIRMLAAVVIQREVPQRPLEHIPPNDGQGDMLWTLMKNCWRYEPEERPTTDHVYKTMKPFVIDSG
ncbi:hypothetical protein FRC12_022313 [Ceratobasidium sp. 428]|nr:hypothetical protein FRC12_022313 [Ceratobasidium sp. 428]